jgi:class 3 adenylate cyclase
MAASERSLPLPDDPVLAAWASVLNGAGHWATFWDAEWRLAFETDELLSTYADMAWSSTPIGTRYYSAEYAQHMAGLNVMYADPDTLRALFLETGPFILATTPGGRDDLRRAVDPQLADLVDELEPQELPDVYEPYLLPWTTAGSAITGSTVWFRIDDDHGQFAGVCILTKPAPGMSHLARAAAFADLAHLSRMHVVEHADRHPAAILMADLEASSPLARHLSTAQFFTFTRRLVRMADECIIQAGGIVGRHVGDGVVAYFLAETAGSESVAARSCIAAARSMRDALAEVAARSAIPTPELSLRFGLHWGATLYVGRILTGGRSEVTALGDEANEAARIEACATGGRILASKALMERLDRADAEALVLDTSRITYTPLAELPTATEKARRDAPGIAVYDLTKPET